MAIYKDYGSPPSYNTTGRVAGKDAISTYGQGTLLEGGAKGQYAHGRGEANPAICNRNNEAPLEFKLDTAAAIKLGDLDVVADHVAKDPAISAVRIYIKAELGETDEYLTVIYDTSAGTISAAEDQVLDNNSESASYGDRASGNDTLVITAENSNGGTAGDATGEVVVSVDAAKNLVITGGSASPADLILTVQLQSDKEAAVGISAALLAAQEANNFDGSSVIGDFETYLTDRGFDVAGLKTIAAGASWSSPPSKVEGQFLGWLLLLFGANVGTVNGSFSWSTADGSSTQICWEGWSGKNPQSGSVKMYSHPGVTLHASFFGALLGWILGRWGQTTNTSFKNALSRQVFKYHYQFRAAALSQQTPPVIKSGAAYTNTVDMVNLIGSIDYCDTSGINVGAPFCNGITQSRLADWPLIYVTGCSGNGGGAANLLGRKLLIANENGEESWIWGKGTTPPALSGSNPSPNTASNGRLCWYGQIASCGAARSRWVGEAGFDGSDLSVPC